MVSTVSLPVDLTTQKILPDWYTNYAMDVLANQKAVSSQQFQPYVDSAGNPIPRYAELSPLQQAGIEATAQTANSFRPELGLASQQAQNVLGRSASNNIKGALSALGATATGSGTSSAKPYLDAGANTNIVGAASPYATRSGASTVRDIQSYMNPYLDAVLNRFGEVGARTLREQLLPEIMHRYIGAGQGLNPSGRNVDEARALRDVYEAVLNQQGQLLQQGYTQAAGLSAADLERYAQLASTMGGLAGQEAQAKLTAGQAFGNIGTAEQRIAADVAQAQAAQTASAYQNDTANQLAAAAALQAIAQQRQQQEMAAAGALTTAGGIQQNQAQQNLDFAKAEFDRAQAYPQQQVNAMASTANALSPAVPAAEQQTGTKTSTVDGSSTGSQILGGLSLVNGITNGGLGNAITGALGKIF